MFRSVFAEIKTESESENNSKKTKITSYAAKTKEAIDLLSKAKMEDIGIMCVCVCVCVCSVSQ